MAYKNCAVLNLGCGELQVDDNAWNVDKRKTALTDQVLDLNELPYPFENSSFEKIYALDIIEHLDSVIDVMNELHRIMKRDGILHIRTTDWSEEQSYTDPTHKHWFTLNSFDFFDTYTGFGQKYHFYTPFKWKILEKKKDGCELVFTLQKIC